MPRIRLSATVDSDLLDEARSRHGGATDAQLIDEALSTLLARYRSAEIDDAYEAVYSAQPITTPD